MKSSNKGCFKNTSKQNQTLKASHL